MKKTPRRIKSTLFNDGRFEKLTSPEKILFLSVLMDPRLSKEGVIRLEIMEPIFHIDWILPKQTYRDSDGGRLFVSKNFDVVMIEESTIPVWCSGPDSYRDDLLNEVYRALETTLTVGRHRLVKSGFIYYNLEDEIIYVRDLSYLDYIVWEEGVEK